MAPDLPPDPGGDQHVDGLGDAPARHQPVLPYNPSNSGVVSHMKEILVMKWRLSMLSSFRSWFPSSCSKEREQLYREAKYVEDLVLQVLC